MTAIQRTAASVWTAPRGRYAEIGRLWRRFFVKPDNTEQHRIAHLHLITSGHPRWAQQIAFRDALRRDEQLANEYEHLKLRVS